MLFTFFVSNTVSLMEREDIIIMSNEQYWIKHEEMEKEKRLFAEAASFAIRSFIRVFNIWCMERRNEKSKGES